MYVYVACDNAVLKGYRRTGKEVYGVGMHKSKTWKTWGKEAHRSRSYRNMPAIEVGPDTLLHGDAARCP